MSTEQTKIGWIYSTAVWQYFSQASKVVVWLRISSLIVRPSLI